MVVRDIRDLEDRGQLYLLGLAIDSVLYKGFRHLNKGEGYTRHMTRNSYMYTDSGSNYYGVRGDYKELEKSRWSSEKGIYLLIDQRSYGKIEGTRTKKPVDDCFKDLGLVRTETVNGGESSFNMEKHFYEVILEFREEFDIYSKALSGVYHAEILLEGVKRHIKKKGRIIVNEIKGKVFQNILDRLNGVDIKKGSVYELEECLLILDFIVEMSLEKWGSHIKE